MAGKILVVEDHPDSRDVLVYMLRHMNYEVIEAETGEQALKKAAAETPDLIIMDLWLPGINGIQATVKLKENPKTAHIPVIAYTASEHQDCREVALKAGMVEFLMKPTHPNTFQEVIRRFLQNRS